MANNNLELQLKIQADLKDARKQIDGLADTVRRLSGNSSEAAKQATGASGGIKTLGRSADAASGSLGKTRAGVESISTQLGRLQSLAGALAGLSIGVGSVRELAGLADQYQNINARIRLVSGSNEQAAQSYQSVLSIANAAGQRVAATAELYTRMARSLKGSASQTELLRVTETISKAAVVSGATAEESSAAIIQLSQGLASGALRGEEFNSVSEQMPRIMDMLQKSLGKTRGELRKMAEDGKLTTEVVFRALMDGAAEIDREMAAMPLTIERAIAELANAWGDWVGATDNAIGASQAVAQVLKGLGENLNTLMTLVSVVAVATGARYVAAFAASIAVTRTKRIETLQLAQAELAEANAATASAQAQLQRAANAGRMNPGGRARAEDALTAALVRQTAAERALTAMTRSRIAAGAMSMLGGPVGIAITGVTLAIGALFTAYTSIQEKERVLELQHKQTIATLGDLTEKTQNLIDKRGELRDVPVADAVQQQTSNADALKSSGEQLAALEARAAKLKTDIDYLSQRPIDNGITLSFKYDDLAKLQKQIDDLRPKFDALNTAQRLLSDGLDERFTQALKFASKEGETLAQRLDKMFSHGPVKGTNWGKEIEHAIALSESALSGMTSESEKLSRALEKELKNATYSAREQLEQLRDAAIEAALAAGKAPEDIDRLTASFEKLLKLQKDVDVAKENKRKTEEAVRQAKSLADSNRKYVEGLEKQAALSGKTQTQTRLYELAEKRLSGALLERAKAALAVIDADEKKNASDATQARNAALQIKYLEAIGDVSGAGLLDVRTEAVAMRRDFEKTGNSEGLAWLDKLLPVQEMKVRADALKKEMDALQSWREQRETSVQAQVNAGLISELDGRRQLAMLHQEVAEKIATTMPALREMAAIPGEAGDNVRALLATMENELLSLRETSNELVIALKDGLQSGIESSLTGLADGTMNLSDAVINLGQSVVKALAQIAAQRLSMIAMDGLMSAGSTLSGLAGSLTGKAAEGVASVVTKTAADTAGDAVGSAAGAATMGASITTASATGAATMGTALTTGGAGISTSLTAAMATGATALTTALATAFATGATTLSAAITAASAGSSAASGLAGIAKAGVSVAAATGGLITGPGTSTSDSIPAALSDGEYVIRAASVRRYGADFLHRINAGALSRFADGGLVSTPDFSRVSVNQTPDSISPGYPGAQAVPSPVLQQTLVFDAGDAVATGLSAPAGNRAMMTWIRANKSTLKQELK